MINLIKIIGILIFIFFWGLVSSSDYEDIKADYIYYAQINGGIIDMDDNGIHDSICLCDYCIEPIEK
jgi:hypothetical protein